MRHTELFHALEFKGMHICRLPLEKPAATQFLLSGQSMFVKSKRPSTINLPRPHPPRAGAYSKRANPPNTAFRRFYERGDLPIAVEHRGMKNVISWKVTSFQQTA